MNFRMKILYKRIFLSKQKPNIRVKKHQLRLFGQEENFFFILIENKES